jgi:FAD/FMN-containing dehydrogenase
MTGNRLRSYSDLSTVRIKVRRAVGRDQFVREFGRAGRAGQRLTLRGAGLSLERQSINSELVLDTSGLTGVRSIDLDKDEVTCAAGTIWGQLVSELRDHERAPLVALSCSAITVGGTTSSDRYGPSAPAFGKFGTNVLGLRLVTPDGEERLCRRDENADLFQATVGGLGYLGMITEVTVGVLHTTADHVSTHADSFESIEATVAALLDLSFNMGDTIEIGAAFSPGPERWRGIMSRLEQAPSDTTRKSLVI